MRSEVKVAEMTRGQPKLTAVEARQMAEEWQRRLAGRATSDSAELVREDRER